MSWSNYSCINWIDITLSGPNYYHTERVSRDFWSIWCLQVLVLCRITWCLNFKWTFSKVYDIAAAAASDRRVSTLKWNHCEFHLVLQIQINKFQHFKFRISQGLLISHIVNWVFAKSAEHSVWLHDKFA